VKRSNRLVILVGLLLAVLAFVAIVILLNQEAEEVPEEEVRETVLVATRDIEIGESVTPDLVEEQEIEPEAVVGTPLRSASQLQGQPALLPVPAGSQVTEQTIGEGRDRSVDVAAMLEPGEKAMAIRVDAQTGTGFLVQAGNSIDIIVSAEVRVLQPTADSAANPDAPQRFEPVPDLEPTRTVKAVLQDKRVLYVSATRAEVPQRQDTNNDGVIDENDAEPEAAAIESVIIVFAGTDQDAEVIKWAQRDRSELSSERNELSRSITAVIRHADDDEIEPTVGVTIDSMVEEYGLRIPSIIDELQGEEPQE
jgi:Flp pilus assembly protein CpaB